MSDQKGLGSKLKRLFIEEGEEGAQAAEAAQSAAEEVARLAQQAAPGAAPRGAQAAGAAAPPAFASATPAPKAPAGDAPVEPAKLDTAGIYRAAGISEDDLAQVARAEQLLKTLPANLPIETQRQILEGTLKTFGVDPQRIRQTIGRQQHALVAYASVVRQDAEKRDAEARTRIEQLRAEALKLERAIEDRARARAGTELACRNQSEQVGRIGEFLPPPLAAPEAK